MCPFEQPLLGPSSVSVARERSWASSTMITLCDKKISQQQDEPSVTPYSTHTCSSLFPTPEPQRTVQLVLLLPACQHKTHQRTCPPPPPGRTCTV